MKRKLIPGQRVVLCRTMPDIHVLNALPKLNLESCLGTYIGTIMFSGQEKFLVSPDSGGWEIGQRLVSGSDDALLIETAAKFNLKYGWYTQPEYVIEDIPIGAHIKYESADGGVFLGTEFLGSSNLGKTYGKTYFWIGVKLGGIKLDSPIPIPQNIKDTAEKLGFTSVIRDYHYSFYYGQLSPSKEETLDEVLDALYDATKNMEYDKFEPLLKKYKAYTGKDRPGFM